MRQPLERMNPLKNLKPRIALLVFVTVGALALFMSWQFSNRLTSTYQEAGRTQLRAIAGTWDDGFRGTDLENPEALQRRIDKLRANNETLHKVSLSWHDRADDTLLVQSGHEHDPGGTKRDVTTGKVQRVGSDNPNPAPIDVGRYDYREVNAADGAHYSELNYPVKRNGQTAAAMELHYDLKDLDPDQAPPRHPPAGHWRLGLSDSA